MSGSDLVFNVAKGKVRYYAELPAANDDLIAVLLKTTGLVADDTMEDYLTLATLLAGASDEVVVGTDAWYARQSLTGVSITQDDTANRVDIDSGDLSWTTTNTTTSVDKLVICYRPDSVGPSVDSAIIPLTMHNVHFIADGNVVTFSVANFARLTN